MKKGAGLAVLGVFIILGIISVVIMFSVNDTQKQTITFTIAKDQIALRDMERNIDSEIDYLETAVWTVAHKSASENLLRGMWNQSSYESLGEWNSSNGVFWFRYGKTNIPPLDEIKNDLKNNIETIFPGTTTNLEVLDDVKLNIDFDGIGYDIKIEFDVESEYSKAINNKLDAKLHGNGNIEPSFDIRPVYFYENTKSMMEDFGDSTDNALRLTVGSFEGVYENPRCGAHPEIIPIDLFNGRFTSFLWSELRPKLPEDLDLFRDPIRGEIIGTRVIETGICVIDEGDPENNIPPETEPEYTREYSYEYVARITVIDPSGETLTRNLFRGNSLDFYEFEFLVEDNSTQSP